MIDGPDPISRSSCGRKAILLVVAFCALLGLSGCRSVYVARLALEQARYLGRARPIGEVLSTETDPLRRAKLQLVLDVRQFAATRGLDPEGSFAAMADTTSSAPFHVVTAAYADRLQAYTWWYPVVGRVPYRGYFERPAAENFAATLRGEDLDVRIVQASAYSTLGWFDDPLPSGLLDGDEAEVAAVVLHELVHQHYFRPGHIAFNETLANAVGLRLAREFFVARDDDERAGVVAKRHQRWLDRSLILDSLAHELQAYFALSRSDGRSMADILEGRAQLYSEARDRLAEAGITTKTETPMENATFLAVWRYARRAELLDNFVAAFGADGAGLEAVRAAVDGIDDPYVGLERALEPEKVLP
jgi:predicted aminopeptidase